MVKLEAHDYIALMEILGALVLVVFRAERDFAPEIITSATWSWIG